MYISDRSKTAFVGTFMWSGASASIKISILDLYITIFRNSRIRHVAHILMGISFLASLAFILSLVLICRPIPFFWEKTIRGQCGDERLDLLIPSIVNLILYLLMLSLPMPLLWGLQVSTKKKVVTCVVFSMGFM